MLLLMFSAGRSLSMFLLQCDDAATAPASPPQRLVVAVDAFVVVVAFFLRFVAAAVVTIPKRLVTVAACPLSIRTLAGRCHRVYMIRRLIAFCFVLACFPASMPLLRVSSTFRARQIAQAEISDFGKRIHFLN
jgi:hypothetical protein